MGGDRGVSSLGAGALISSRLRSTLLQDLREIGERKGRDGEFTERIRALREAHAKKPSFLARLRKAGL